MVRYFYTILILLITYSFSFSQCNGPFNPCSICNVQATITNIVGGTIVDGNSTIPGTLSEGGSSTGDNMEVNAENCGELEITVDITFDWQNGENQNWVHGVSFSGSAGWTGNAGVPPGPNWIALNTITGCCSNNTYGEGYYYEDPAGGTDGCCGTADPANPADNYGADNDPGLYTFELTYCASSNQDQANENIVFNITEDGESGDWSNSDGCNYEFTFPIDINSAGLQLPDETGPICSGDCVTLDAGEGCDNYSWSTGETTQTIEVCPLFDEIYSVTVSDGEECMQEDFTEVLIMVCCEADAGDIAAMPTPVCPGEEITITVTNHQEDPAYAQYILVVDGSGDIIEVIAGTTHTLTSDVCAQFTVYSYNYLIDGEAPEPVVGMNINDINCDDEEVCCDLQSIIVSFEDLIPPMFINAPIDLNLACFDLLPTMDDLEWTDNCFPGDIAIGIETGTADLCPGGTITRTWEALDGCGNMSTHIQTISISAPDPITFDNTPVDETRDCSNIPGPGASINYTNNGAGDCLSEGTSDPIRVDNYNICGGSITNTWEATDNCGNMISHIQTYTINPTPEAVFLDMPDDLTFACGEYDNDPVDLDYSNGETGDCIIEGSVSPTSTGLPNYCGGTMTHTWDFTDDCGRNINHVQTITLDPAPPAMFLDTPDDITLTCEEIVPTDDLAYTNNADGDCLIEGVVSPTTSPFSRPCGGTITNTWEYTDGCGRTILNTQNIVLEPAPEPDFLDYPDDITIACTEDLNEPPVLEYSNFANGDCLIEGTVTAIQVGEVDVCGSTIVYTWLLIDPCSRTITHNQSVTIEPVDPPEFLDYPDDMLVECSEIPTEAPDLEYSNNGVDPCLISGFVAPIVTENYDSCGGEIIYVWEYMDKCGNEISHTQIIEVLPLRDPEFINPPDDIELECGADVPPPTPLRYTNHETGDCALEGEIIPTVEDLGSEVIYTYIYENECTGFAIEHIQTIFIPEVPDILIDPVTDTICQGEQYDLLDIIIFDQNNTGPFITYHDATPPTDQNEILDLLVSPDNTTIYYVVATSVDDCQDIEEFNLVVLEAAYAGEDNSGYLCFGASNVNLFDYLIDADNNNGDWIEVSSSGIDISDPSSVNFSNQSPGLFVFNYLLSSPLCDDDFAVIELTLNEELLGDITLVQCSDDRNSYTVGVNAYGDIVTVNTGTLSGPNMDIYSITLIPINETLVITISNGQDTCQHEIIIDPPNCNCPNVDPPLSLGNKEICQGDTNPALQVQVGPDETAHWYDSPNGGNLILANSLSYTPSETAPGVYTYYVESESTTDPGCKSATRTPISLQIFSLPDAHNGSIENCDEDEDGLAIFDLSTSEVELTDQLGLTFEYYLSRMDAESQTNPLVSPYTSIANPQILFVRVINGSNCFRIVELTLNTNLQPSISVDVMDETCLGLSDGIATINSTSTNQPIEYSINNFIYYSSNIFDSLEVGTYTAYVQDAKACSNSKEFIIGEGLELSIDLLEEECSDNGTNTDETDDNYTISFIIVNNLGRNGQYEVSIGANTFGTFTYGVEESIVLNADNSSPTLRFTDVISGCFIEREIGPLNSCSSDCELTLNNISTDCFDNGTPLDPTDDFYTISLNVTALNGSSTNQYRLFVNGIRIGIYTYGDDITFDLPADGDNASMTIEDLTDDQCRLNESLGRLDPCSNGCLVEALVFNIECDDNATIGEEGDDIFSFEISTTSVNISNRWYVEGLSDTMDYGSSNSYGVFPISGGSITYIIIDTERPECRDTVTIEPPNPCSNPCEIIVEDLVISDCNNNNTGYTELDDYFSVEFTISSISGPTTDYTVTDGNVTWGPYSYNISVEIDGFQANGNTIHFDIIDGVSAQCQTSFEASQTSCSSCDQSIDAGLDQLISCLTPDVTLIGTSSHPGTVLWNGPNSFTSSTLEVTVDINGWYYLMVSYPDGCEFIDSVFVNIDADIPVANAGPDQQLNCIISEINLDGTESSSGPNLIYEWTDEQGNILSNDPTYLAQNQGSYYLQIIDTVNNCKSPKDEIIVSLYDHQPDGVIFADPGYTLDCVVEALTLSSLNEENVIYTWTFDNQDFYGSIKVIIDSGYVSLYALDTISGCDTITGINIEDFTQFPLIKLDAPKDIDCIAPTVTIQASGSQHSRNLLIKWTNENGDILNEEDYSIDVTLAGTYYFTLRDTILGCETMDSVTVDNIQDFPTVDAGPDQSVECDQDSVILLAGTIANAGDNSTVLWTTESGSFTEGEDGLTPIVNESGIYTLTVINTDNGCGLSDSVNVSIDDNIPELALLETDDVRCKGETNGSIFITEVQGGTPPYSYFIDGQRIPSPTMGNLSPGFYNLRIIDAKECEMDTSFTILEGTEFFTGIDSLVEIEFGDQKTLYVLVNIPEEDIASIQWIPADNLTCDSCLITEIDGIVSKNYQVIITDKKGCISRANLRLIVNKNINLFIPNSFSPNGDGTNDQFTVYADRTVLNVNSMEIFNRWGDRVFSEQNFPPNLPEFGWDGTHLGDELNPAVFVYTIEVLLLDGSIKTVSGDISLIK